MTLTISDTYSKNSNGPRTDPSGTLNSQTIVLYQLPPTETNCDLSLKYELSRCSAQPDITKLRSSQDFNVLGQ